MLLHDAAIAGVHVDSWRLYDTTDVGYLQWLESAVDVVIQTRRKQEERASNP